MRPSLTIAIDFDDTFTADCETWREAILLLQRSGHRVICVSARRNELSHRQELTQALPDGVPVLLSYDTPKRSFAKLNGYDVDIWIDDMPEAIPTKADMMRHCG
jgi:hypothetical protein